MRFFTQVRYTQAKKCTQLHPGAPKHTSVYQNTPTTIWEHLSVNNTRMHTRQNFSWCYQIFVLVVSSTVNFLWCARVHQIESMCTVALGCSTPEWTPVYLIAPDMDTFGTRRSSGVHTQAHRSHAGESPNKHKSEKLTKFKLSLSPKLPEWLQIYLQVSDFPRCCWWRAVHITMHGDPSMTWGMKNCPRHMHVRGLKVYC